MARLEGEEDGDVSVAHSRKDPAHLPHHFLSPCDLPVVAPQHDQRVARCDRSAGGAGQHLVGGTNTARKVHIHEWVVLLDVAEVEVTEVVDRVV